jgi:predicted nucleotidyltransferase
MPVEIPADKMADYLAMARRRHEQEQAQMRAALQAREALARRAARLLKEEFGASRVVVFGSLVQPAMFNLHSDVDLAAWGIQPEDTFRAIGAVYDLSSEIELNLVDVAVARPSVYRAILAQGVDL